MQKYTRLFNVISYAKPGRVLIISIALLSVLTTLSSLLFPLITQILIDSYSDSTSRPGLLVFLVLMLTAGAITSGISFYLLGQIGNRMLVNLRSKTLAKAVYLPTNYYDTNSSSEPASRIVNDTEIINQFVSRHLEPVISSVLTLVASMVVLWFLDWQMTGVLFGTLFLAVIIVVPIASKMYALSKSLQEKEAEFLGFVVERLSQIRLVKAYTAEQHTISSGQENLDQLYEIRHGEVKVSSFIAPIGGLTVIFTLIIILGFGAVRVNEGIITMGTLIAFILYMFNIVMPMVQLTSFSAELNKAAGAAQRVVELVELEDESGAEGAELPAKNKDIVFDQICFSYSPDTPVLTDLSLSIPANQMVAFVGESGAGKSTLFSLLLKYYEPTAGDILVGGQSLRLSSVHGWRSQIGYIAQDTPMLSGTIRDNLLIGISQIPDDERIYDVLNLAQLEGFVRGLTEGLNTQVGERGVTLSGGQKQRVAIARALLQDKPILLCDEATSNLDASTEYKIQQAMKQLKTHRTTLISAHRLSTVLDADNIIVLKGGCVVGQGSHTELLETQSYYRELVEHQLRPFEEAILAKVVTGEEEGVDLENDNQDNSFT